MDKVLQRYEVQSCGGIVGIRQSVQISLLPPPFLDPLEEGGWGRQKKGPSEEEGAIPQNPKFYLRP